MTVAAQVAAVGVPSWLSDWTRRDFRWAGLAGLVLLMLVVVAAYRLFVILYPSRGVRLELLRPVLPMGDRFLQGWPSQERQPFVLQALVHNEGPTRVLEAWVPSGSVRAVAAIPDHYGDFYLRWAGSQESGVAIHRGRSHKLDVAAAGGASMTFRGPGAGGGYMRFGGFCLVAFTVEIRESGSNSDPWSFPCAVWFNPDVEAPREPLWTTLERGAPTDPAELWIVLSGGASTP